MGSTTCGDSFFAAEVMLEATVQTPGIDGGIAMSLDLGAVIICVGVRGAGELQRYFDLKALKLLV